MNDKRFVITLVLSISMLLSGFYLAFGPGGSEQVYGYQVKSEQVEADAGYNGTAVALEDLDHSHREAVFDAYKKSDHFLGGSSAYIETSEPLNLSEDDRWQVVSIEGVRVLVGISGPETSYSMTGIGAIGSMALSVGFTGLMFTIMLWHDLR